MGIAFTAVGLGLYGAAAWFSGSSGRTVTVRADSAAGRALMGDSARPASTPDASSKDGGWAAAAGSAIASAPRKPPQFERRDRD